MESVPTFHEGDAPSLEDDPALGLSHRAKMEVLFAVMLGLFLGALDQTIVGPALPTIVTQLSGNEYYVWAITIYLLTSTISVPFWGKLSDIYGRKPIFMIGIVIFLIGSALSGLSQNMAMLILFRGIQGIGAGSLFPVALAVIGDLFTPAERGKYQGLFGAVFGIAFVAGPLIGGWLTENLSWHWIFYVNIPIGIIALVVIQRLLPTVKTKNATRNFDLIGGCIFTVSMVFLLVGLTNKQFSDWTEPTVGGFVLIGIVGHAAVHRRRVLRQGADRPARPVEGHGPTRRRWCPCSSPRSPSSGRSCSCRAGSRSSRTSRRRTPAWRPLPLMVGLIASSIISGLIVSRTGRYKFLIVGSVIVMGIAVFLMTGLTKDTPVVVVWFWMFLAGIGVGPTFSVPTIVIQNAVPFRQLGVATSNLTFFRQIGGTIALAFVGTIFGTTFSEQLGPQIVAAGVPAQAVAAFQQGGGAFDLSQLTGVGDLATTLQWLLPPEAQVLIPNIVEGIHGAFSLATAQTFWLGVVRGRRRGSRGPRDQGDPAPRDERGAGSHRRHRRRAGGQGPRGQAGHLGRLTSAPPTTTRSRTRPGRSLSGARSSG